MITFKHLTGDLYGGVTAAIVALPLALAFGVQSGMGAIAGLYGAIAVGFFAALFGGTETQISGPTGPMTVVSSAVIAAEIATYGSVEAAFPTIIATFVLAGAFLVLMGVLRIGQYIRYMPYPVVSGFMTGIGLIIIILQIFPFFGMKSPPSIIDTFANIGDIFNGMNPQALMLSAGTLAIIYLFPRITKKVPSTLVALFALTIVSVLLDMDVSIIGDIPKGLPEVHIDTILGMDWHHPMAMVIPALTLAALGAIDSLLTSVVADNMTKTQHDSNKELIGQGIGNMAAGFIGGLPGAGATMRTVVNIRSGGKTRLSGMIHAVILLMILVGAGVYAKLIPLPVLAGILISVGIGIIDYKGLKHIMHVPRADAVVMVIVIILTVFVDLLQAVAVGLVLAALLFMKQMADLAESKAVSGVLSELQDTELYPDEVDIPEEIKSQIHIHHFDGPIFFGFADHLKTMTKKHPEVSVVIFRMEKVPTIDQSGMYAIEDAVLELERRGVNVVMVGLQKQPEDMLRNIRLIPDVIEEEHCFATFKEAIETMKKHWDKFSSQQ
ncbi:MAG: SulP family inorganic anion transporter [Sulfurovum sp.]|nr:SulP family inorganic anion transporter [Sulfurovum sp.]